MDIRKIACALAALAAVSSVARAGDDKAKAKADAEMKAMTAAWEKAAAVNENHQRLQKAVGSWTTETKSWTGPGDPQVSTGTSEARALMDGRYVAEDFRGTMMGKPFTGMGVDGYDNLKKKFVSTWIDSMGTGIAYGEGTLDAKGQLTTILNFTDAMTGKPTKMRVVTRWEGDNKRVAEFYEKQKGKEVKTMEITYTRKGGAAK